MNTIIPITIIKDVTTTEEILKIGTNKIKIPENSNIEIGSTIVIGTPPNSLVTKVIDIKNIGSFASTDNKILILNTIITKEYPPQTPVVSVETIYISLINSSLPQGENTQTYTVLTQSTTTLAPTTTYYK